jgi:GrpB-like predicted nucleotidyltransferase (UPF0157 family)
MDAMLERQIHAASSAKVLLLEHVGSTSVPGFSAKATIDMVMAVSDSADEGAYVAPLERIGMVLRIREPDWFEHRLLKSPAIDGNLHVFSRVCAEIDRMLAFRDRLRTNGDDRMLYERTKRELAACQWRHTQNYADAKIRGGERDSRQSAWCGLNAALEQWGQMLRCAASAHSAGPATPRVIAAARTVVIGDRSVRII